MLYLLFGGPSAPQKTVGPLAQVRLEGEVLREVAGGPVIAMHRNHLWELGDERYSHFYCSHGISIRFEGQDASDVSTQFGPYSKFFFRDGIAACEDQVFAFVDRQGEWYCHVDKRHWRTMVIIPD